MGANAKRQGSRAYERVRYPSALLTRARERVSSVRGTTMVAAGRKARCTPRSTRARDGGAAVARFDGRAAPTVNARGTRALWRQSQRRLLANTLLHGRVADSREVSKLGIREDLRSFGHWGGEKLIHYYHHLAPHLHSAFRVCVPECHRLGRPSSFRRSLSKIDARSVDQVIR